MPHYLCVEFVSVADLTLRIGRLLELTEVINREFIAAADIPLKLFILFGKTLCTVKIVFN